MTDRIFDTFLRHQYDQGLALAADSDLVRILPIGDPADREDRDREVGSLSST